MNEKELATWIALDFYFMSALHENSFLLILLGRRLDFHGVGSRMQWSHAHVLCQAV